MQHETAYSKTIEGFGLLLGTLVGAGLFVLPSVFYRAGIKWGLFFFALTFLLSLAFHYLYAALIAITPGRHRFPGYMKIYLGGFAEKLSLALTFLSFYGAVLAYGILGGIFLEAFLGVEFFQGAIAFFILGGLLFKMDLRAVGKANFYLTVLLFLFIAGFSFVVMPQIRVEHFYSALGEDWFLPYGVLLFAFAGHSALPDLFEVVGRNSQGRFKKIIFWSLAASAAVYLIFIAAILGVSGSGVTEDALSGLYRTVGDGFIAVGSLIGLLAVFTSYVALGVDLKLTFHYDYRFSDTASWLLAFLPPVLLFVLGLDDLTKILSVVGAVGLGAFSFLTVLAAWKKREEVERFLNIRLRPWWLYLIAVLVAAGVTGEILSFFR
ncbi:MAG: aromatic amino acid transport family protein [Patescibacteria group bacterium]